MFKGIRTFTDGIKFVLKYGTLITVILGILGFAVEGLEKWQKDNEPKDVK